MVNLADVGTVNAQSWITGNILPLVILVLAVVIAMLARKKDFRAALTVVAILVIGLMVAAMASGTHAADVGNWALGLVGVGGK